MGKMKLLRAAGCILLVGLLTAACGSRQLPAPSGENATTSAAPTVASQTTETACTTIPTQTLTQPEDEISEYVKWIDTTIPQHAAGRLFSIAYDKELEGGLKVWTVYADGTVILSDLNEKLAEETLSEDDFQKLLSAVTREKVEGLKVKTQDHMCDGGCIYLMFYAENEELLLSKGGRSPIRGEFTDLFYEIYWLVSEYIEGWQ